MIVLELIVDEWEGKKVRYSQDMCARFHGSEAAGR